MTQAYPDDASLQGIAGLAHRFNLSGLKPDSYADESLLERCGTGAAGGVGGGGGGAAVAAAGPGAGRGGASRTHVPHFLSRLVAALPRRHELACALTDVTYVMRTVMDLPLPSRPIEERGAGGGAGGGSAGASSAAGGAAPATYKRPTTDVFAQRAARRQRT